jgi:hypothetical protein
MPPERVIWILPWLGALNAVLLVVSGARNNALPVYVSQLYFSGRVFGYCLLVSLVLSYARAQNNDVLCSALRMCVFHILP